VEHNTRGETGGTDSTKINYNGFIVERERGGTDVILYNAQNVAFKLAMPLGTFDGLMHRMVSAGWIGESRAAPSTLGKTGTDG
jgi:hypothetical protein